MAAAVAEIVSTGDFYNAVQDEDVRRRDELNEARQKADVKLLGDERLSYREYRERRDKGRSWFVDAGEEQDSMDFKDYRLSREDDLRNRR
jgi:hypothetical protein